MLLVKGICSTEVPHTMADPDLQIKGGGGFIHTLTFLDQFGLKGSGGLGRPGNSPRSTTAIERGVFVIAMIYHVGNYCAKNFRSDLTNLDVCYQEKMSLLTIVWINADF